MIPSVVAIDAIWLTLAISAQAVVPVRMVRWVRALAIYVALEMVLHKPAEDLVAEVIRRLS